MLPLRQLQAHRERAPTDTGVWLTLLCVLRRGTARLRSTLRGRRRASPGLHRRETECSWGAASRVGGDSVGVHAVSLCLLANSAYRCRRFSGFSPSIVLRYSKPITTRPAMPLYQQSIICLPKARTKDLVETFKRHAALVFKHGGNLRSIEHHGNGPPPRPPHPTIVIIIAAAAVAGIRPLPARTVRKFAAADGVRHYWYAAVTLTRSPARTANIT